MGAARHFFKGDAGGGVVLLLAAVLALILANSPISHSYEWLLGTRFAGLSVQGWINDLLMAGFFLYAGLEIKREILAGSLSSWQRAGLPILVAIGGMLVPAVVYLMLAGDGYAHGWAIPAATDIAFALGVFALVGPRIPLSVRALLLAIAVMDDLGAILVIALFYSGGIAWGYLALTFVIFGALLLLNRAGVVRYTPYMLVGLAMWWAMLQSGLHPTLAGVLLAFTIPMRAAAFSPLEVLMHRLHPGVTYVVLPVFALANAGVSLEGITWADTLHPVTLGIALGLFVGKQIGIFGTLYVAIKSPYFLMPDKASWGHLYGMSMLCGIGFTMALFIGGLAFTDPDMAAYVRMGVLGGSLLSAICGYGVLRAYANRPIQESYE